MQRMLDDEMIVRQFHLPFLAGNLSMRGSIHVAVHPIAHAHLVGGTGVPGRCRRTGDQPGPSLGGVAGSFSEARNSVRAAS